MRKVGCWNGYGVNRMLGGQWGVEDGFGEESVIMDLK